MYFCTIVSRHSPHFIERQTCGKGQDINRKTKILTNTNTEGPMVNNRRKKQ